MKQVNLELCVCLQSLKELLPTSFPDGEQQHKLLPDEFPGNSLTEQLLQQLPSYHFLPLLLSLLSFNRWKHFLKMSVLEDIKLNPGDLTKGQSYPFPKRVPVTLSRDHPNPGLHTPENEMGFLSIVWSLTAPSYPEWEWDKMASLSERERKGSPYFQEKGWELVSDYSGPNRYWCFAWSQDQARFF